MVKKEAYWIKFTSLFSLGFFLTFVIFPVLYGWTLYEKLDFDFNPRKKYSDRLYNIAWYVNAKSLRKNPAPIIPYFLLHKVLFGQIIYGGCYDCPPLYEEEFILFLARSVASKGNPSTIEFKHYLKSIFIGSWISLTQSKVSLVNYYTNTMPFGENIYGLEKGAMFHFHKPVQELGDKEIINLMIRSINPNLYRNREEELNEKVLLIYKAYLEKNQ